MKQILFTQTEHQNKKKVTCRERLLAQMEEMLPWQRLIDALSPAYFPNAAGKRGRLPIGLERMLWIYFLQQWYALDDEVLEDAIYNSQTMRDPKMKRTSKGNQWYFGMKARIGVDAATGLTHTVVATSANVADVTMVEHLVWMNGDNRVHVDPGYIGMGKCLGEEKDAEDSRCCIVAKQYKKRIHGISCLS